MCRHAEAALVKLKDFFSLSQAELDIHGAYSKVAKAAVLREVLEGKVPGIVTFQGRVPFNFQKDEQVVWVFQDVMYGEIRTRRQFVGTSHGMSLRIAKGLYYRTSIFRGTPVESTEMVGVARGMLAVTTKHICFSSAPKSFRLRYGKIVSYQAYSDGIILHREAATAKPQAFVTGDGWFTYNLIINVKEMLGSA